MTGASGAVLSAMLASLWLGGCLALAAALLLRVWPLEAHWRYRVWVLVLAATLGGLLAGPVGRQPAPATLTPARLPEMGETGQSAGPDDGGSSPRLEQGRPGSAAPREPAAYGRLRQPPREETAATGPVPGRLELPPRLVLALVALVLCGAGLGLLRLVLQIVALTRLKRRAVTPPAGLDLLWHEARDRIPTPRSLRLLISPDIGLPVACGYFRPAVLVPGSLTGALSEEETEHLLLHELAHLVRRDDWGLLLERLVGAFCWWHPVVWWVSRRMEQEREQACDRLVAARSDRRRYARTLVRLAELAAIPRRGLAPGALRGELTRRVEALLAGPATPPRFARQAPVALLAGATLFFGLRVSPPLVGSRPTAVPTPARPQPALATGQGYARGPEGLALDSIFTRYADSGFSGTVLLARRGEVLLEKGYGLADREHRVPATADTRYSTAGITKLFTATALLTLAGEGRLDLADPVGRWVGPLPGPKAGVTLDELLTYSDGLTRLNAPVQRDDAGDFVRAVGTVPASFMPGTGYRYNDHGHSLLGLVIERASGEGYEAFVRRRFLLPAGLAATGFENEGGTIAVEYAGPADAQQAVGRRAYRWGRRASLGLVSTAGDLYRWFRALSDPAVVPPAVQAELFQVRRPTDYGTQQGYGLELVNRGPDHRLWRRVAGTPGFEGELLYDPATDWTAVILVNSRLGWRFRVWREIERAMWPGGEP